MSMHSPSRRRIIPVRTVFELCAGAIAVAMSLSLAAGSAVPAEAHGATAGDLPLVPEPVTLKHLRPADVIALFGRETLPVSPNGGPRAARVESRGSLLPRGVEAVMRSSDGSTVVLVGAENRFLEMQECLEVLDVPVEQVSPGRKRVVLTLRHADRRRLHSVVRKLPGNGSALVSGSRLTLEGSVDWLHRALREVIRAELNLVGAAEHPSP